MSLKNNSAQLLFVTEGIYERFEHSGKLLRGFTKENGIFSPHK